MTCHLQSQIAFPGVDGDMARSLDCAHTEEPLVDASSGQSQPLLAALCGSAFEIEERSPRMKTIPAVTETSSPCTSRACKLRAGALHAAVVLASIAAASVALVACGPDASHAQGHAAGAGGPPPAAVAVVSVAASNLAMNYEYVGQTAGSRDVEVRARVSGILLKRNFTEGGNVKRGQS